MAPFLLELTAGIFHTRPGSVPDGLFDNWVMKSREIVPDK
jgi:hypothetical protein